MSWSFLSKRKKNSYVINIATLSNGKSTCDRKLFDFFTQHYQAGDLIKANKAIEIDVSGEELKNYLDQQNIAYKKVLAKDNTYRVKVAIDTALLVKPNKNNLYDRYDIVTYKDEGTAGAVWFSGQRVKKYSAHQVEIADKKHQRAFKLMFDLYDLDVLFIKRVFEEFRFNQLYFQEKLGKIKTYFRTDKKGRRYALLSMPKIEGKTVLEVIDASHYYSQAEQKWHSTVAPVLAWDMISATALALKTLNSKNIVHLDIKPENLIFNEQTHTIIVIDFGGAALKNTEFYMKFYTLPYAAPEIIAAMKNRQPWSPKNSADIYSFGVLWAELLLGVKFSEESSSDGIRQEIQSAENKHFKYIPRHIKQELINFMLACVAENAEDRPRPDEIIAFTRRFLVWTTIVEQLGRNLNPLDKDNIYQGIKNYQDKSNPQQLKKFLKEKDVSLQTLNKFTAMLDCQPETGDNSSVVADTSNDEYNQFCQTAAAAFDTEKKEVLRYGEIPVLNDTLVDYKNALKDFYNQLYHNDWHTAGRGWSSKKMPAGIKKLRKILPEGLDINDCTYDDIRIMWKTIREVLSQKHNVPVGFWHQRNQHVQRFYDEKFHLFNVTFSAKRT